jgi:hypothetical protein
MQKGRFLASIIRFPETRLESNDVVVTYSHPESTVILQAPYTKESTRCTDSSWASQDSSIPMEYFSVRERMVPMTTTSS